MRPTLSVVQKGLRRTEDVMKGWSVNDEHGQCGAANDTKVVVVVPHDLFAERRLELGLDGKHLMANNSIRRGKGVQVKRIKLTLKHWHKKILK